MTCINKQYYSLANNNPGFTLVELIVVILIVGILSVSVAPRFFGVASYENRKATDELLSALRHTQQMAMNRGGNIELVLNANSFTVQIAGGTPLRSPSGQTPYSITFPTSITATPDIIRFNPLGQPVNALNNPLTNNTSILINGTPKITIEADTGYAH